MKKKHKKGTYWLDLADNGYWLIKNETGYRECVGAGDEGKKAALEKIERLNKGGQMSKLNQEELLKQLRLGYIGVGGYTDGGMTLEAYHQIVALIQKPEVTEEWIWKAIDYIKEYPTYHRLEEKLKEVGIEVIKK